MRLQTSEWKQKTVYSCDLGNTTPFAGINLSMKFFICFSYQHSKAISTLQLAIVSCSFVFWWHLCYSIMLLHGHKFIVVWRARIHKCKLCNFSVLIYLSLLFIDCFFLFCKWIISAYLDKWVVYVSDKCKEVCIDW